MSNKPEATNPVHERPGYLLKRIQQAPERELNRRLRTLNLSIAQYAALAALEEHPGLWEVEKKLTAQLGSEQEPQLKTALGAFLNVLETPT